MPVVVWYLIGGAALGGGGTWALLDGTDRLKWLVLALIVLAVVLKIVGVL